MSGKLFSIACMYCITCMFCITCRCHTAAALHINRYIATKETALHIVQNDEPHNPGT